MIHTQREWVEGKRVIEVSKEASDRIAKLAGHSVPTDATEYIHLP